jgi:glucose uptake protein
VGNLGYDGFSFLDDLEHAGKRQWFYGFVAGVIFNFANMLLVAALSVSGMAVAFPVGIGMAIIMGSFLSYIVKPTGNLPILLAGCALIAAAIIVAAIACNILGVIRHEELARAGKAKSTRRPTTVKGVILALVSGLLMGSFFPLVQKGTEGEVGLGPYAITAVFALGIFLSAFVFDLFYINLPVQGEPLEISEFFHTRPGHHLLGVLGGVLWCGGAVASFAASAAPAQAQLSPALHSLLAQGYPLVAALWGLLAWKEFRGGDTRLKASALIMLVLFAGGLVLISLAPAYVRRG